MDGKDSDTQWLAAGFAATCRRLGLKITPQRLETYLALVLAGNHPDAKTIYRRVRRRLPAISFDTVYRTLHVFEERGVIARVATPGESARFDANTGRHHHFTCTRCDAITDFCSPELDAIRPPAVADELGAVGALRVELRGICRKCAGKAGST
jgi:Fur family peroxide stress response transcriptional regulator